VMPSFFDTSAIVPLILKEPHSEVAGIVWEETSRRIAWQWLRVEVEAGLIRRIAPPEAWNQWHVIESAMDWVEPEAGRLEHLRAFNRGAGLRSADVGHLYLMGDVYAENPACGLLHSMTKCAMLRPSAASRWSRRIKRPPAELTRKR
jgi:hypothetical protein